MELPLTGWAPVSIFPSSFFAVQQKLFGRTVATYLYSNCILKTMAGGILARAFSPQSPARKRRLSPASAAPGTTPGAASSNDAILKELAEMKARNAETNAPNRAIGERIESAWWSCDHTGRATRGSSGSRRSRCRRPARPAHMECWEGYQRLHRRLLQL